MKSYDEALEERRISQSVPLMPVEPRIIRGSRQFVAVSPPDVALRVGAVGRTEQEARARFAEEWAEWMDLRARRKAEEALRGDSQ